MCIDLCSWPNLCPCLCPVCSGAEVGVTEPVYSIYVTVPQNIRKNVLIVQYKILSTMNMIQRFWHIFLQNQIFINRAIKEKEAWVPPTLFVICSLMCMTTCTWHWHSKSRKQRAELHQVPVTGDDFHRAKLSQFKDRTNGHNFADIWNSMQNILPIHWKMCNLLRREGLRSPRFTGSWARWYS